MKVTGKDAPEMIHNKRGFTNHGGTFRGDLYNGMPSPLGYMSMAAERVMRESMGEGGYVVYSYATPIAWYSNATGEWYYDDIKHSATTSRHQFYTRQGISEGEGMVNYLTS